MVGRVCAVLEVVASERIEPLVADLAARLVADPLDPMTPEWIAVGSDGLQRWLQLELAKHLGARDGRSDGVAANITFAYPGTLRTAVLLAGTERPEFDPWLVDQLVWSVMESLVEHAGDPMLAAFADTSRRSLYRRARQIAERFGAYQLHRPAMLRAWFDGNDVDAAGRPLPAHQLWQPHLWRLVRGDAGVASPAERLDEALTRVRNNSVRLEVRGRELPPRLVFFGPSLLPTGAGFLEVAEAVAAHRDVLVYVIEPSSALSKSLRSGGVDLSTDYHETHDVAAQSAAHPLLRSWGRLQRETALLLSPFDTHEVTPGTVGAPGTGDPATVAGQSLLGRLQHDIRANLAPTPTHELDPADRSLQLHFGYGASRQVEVLRDVVLDLLNATELTEDDIMIVCPQVETMAPVIESVFGAPATRSTTVADDGTPLLRYRITGLSTAGRNPVIAALVSMLDIAASNFDVTRVAEFLAMPAVRERFGWTEDHLATLTDWLRDTNIRWGLDRAHRERFGLPTAIEGYTWHDALDQMLVGTAVLGDDNELAIAGVVPFERASADVELAGQLAAVITSLESLAVAGDSERPIAAWIGLLNAAIDQVLAPGEDAPWQLEDAQRLLVRIAEVTRLDRGGAPRREDGTPDTSAVSLSLRDLRAIVEDTVGESRTRSDFFRGGITVTSLSALRNIPVPVVCLLGADQGAFSAGGSDGDDLIGLAPRLGDRDRRAEVRQTLLDAFLSASQRFIVFADGHDVRTNAELPPAVVLAELIDAVRATVAGGSDSPGPLDAAVVHHHPRQPFDEAYFVDDSPLVRSYNRSAFGSAVARRGRDGSQRIGIDWANARIDQPAIGDRVDVIELAMMQAALESPMRVFLRDGVGMRLPHTDDALVAELPIEIGGLDRWGLGTDLLDVLAAGRDLAQWSERQERRGVLPPLTLAGRTVANLGAETTALIETATANGVRLGEPHPLAIDLVLPSGQRIVDTVDDRLEAPRRGVATLSFSREKVAAHLKGWVELLALYAADPTEDWAVVQVARNADPKEDRPSVTVLRGRDLTASAALDTLEFLAAFHHAALRQPIPFFPASSLAIHQANSESEIASVWKKERARLRDEKLIVGSASLEDLRAIGAEGHDLIADADSDPVDAYADAIWRRFDATVMLDEGVAAPTPSEEEVGS